MNYILNLLSKNGMMRVTDLADQCTVSDVTLRRDLRRLEADGLVFVAHGAASLNPGSETLRIGDQYFISQQQLVHRQEKAAIGKRAAQLVQRDETIVIDTGTTPYFLARELPANYNLTVICFSLNSFIELHDRPDISLIFPGGYFHSNTLMCESEEALALVKRHRASKAFLGATGIHEQMGVTSSNPFEQKMKEVAMESSLTNVLLVDSFKFGVVQTSYFADLHDFRTIVTDTGIPEKYATIIREQDVELIIAE